MLDNQIGFSTVRVELIPDSINRPIVEEPWSAKRSCTERVAGTSGDATRFADGADLGVRSILTPLLLVVLIPLAILIWLVRIWVGRRRRERGLNALGVDTLRRAVAFSP